MNIRLQLYKKYRLQGLSAYQSALKAGYSISTAEKAGSVLEKNGEFKKLLVKNGLDDLYLVKHLAEGLQAKKPIAADVMIRNENGKLVAVKNENDWIEYEDWNVRHKYYETALKLMGRPVKDEDAQEKGPGRVVNIIIQNNNGDTSTERPVPTFVSVQPE